MIRAGLVVLVCLALATSAQKHQSKDGLMMSEQETLSRVQSQLLGAMALLESLEEPQPDLGADGSPLKAEKRRNKFEFIRFGRK